MKLCYFLIMVLRDITYTDHLKKILQILRVYAAHSEKQFLYRKPLMQNIYSVGK